MLTHLFVLSLITQSMPLSRTMFVNNTSYSPWWCKLKTPVQPQDVGSQTVENIGKSQKSPFGINKYGANCAKYWHTNYSAGGNFQLIVVSFPAILHAKTMRSRIRYRYISSQLLLLLTNHIMIYWLIKKIGFKFRFIYNNWHYLRVNWTY